MDPIPVLYADDDLCVVDKPAGMLVVPAPGRGEATLISRLGTQLGLPVYAVHRLDEDTTGVLVVALTDAARAGMEDLFRRHEVERDYLALVCGQPSPRAGRIESRLREEGGVVRVAVRGGQMAVTCYETLARRGRFALLRCSLETGRRNQIRAHMQALGHPLAGDRKYGFRARTGERFARPMLHSWRIAFRHPIRGFEVRVQVEPREVLLQPPAE